MSLQYPVIKYPKISFLNIIPTLSDGSCMYSSFFRMYRIYNISLANTYFSDCDKIEDEDIFIECVKHKLAYFVSTDNSGFIKEIFENFKTIIPSINNNNRNTFGRHNESIKKTITNKKTNNETKFKKFKIELQYKILDKTAYATEIEYSLLHHLLPDIINENVLTAPITELDFHKLMLDENKLIFFSSGLHYQGMITDKKLEEVLDIPPPLPPRKRSSNGRNQTGRTQNSRVKTQITPRLPRNQSTIKKQSNWRSHITVVSNNNSNKSAPPIPPRTYSKQKRTNLNKH